MILDEEATVEVALRLKAQLRRIDKNKDERHDPDILQGLQGEFYDKIFRFLGAAVTEFALGANEHDRHDLSQDGYLKILRNIKSFNTRKGKIYSWMTMIVKNMCIDWARKKRPEIGLPDDAREIAEKPTASRDMPKETFDTLKAFFPFFASDELIFELLAVVDKSQYRASNYCVNAVTKLLIAHHIDYTEYGKPQEMTQAIIIVLRGLLLTPLTDRTDIIQANLSQNPRFDVLRTLTFFLGAKQTAQLVLLFGGMQIQLPAPHQFFKITDNTR